MFADMVEKRVEILVITFAHFHPLISMKVATRNFMKNPPHIPRGTKQHSSRQDSGMGGSQNFGQRDCGTSGANGQAELLEAGWALQVLEGTNSLGKRSIVSSWRHKFLWAFRALGFKFLEAQLSYFPGNILPFTNSLENVALWKSSILSSWRHIFTGNKKRLGSWMHKLPGNRALWALECTNSLENRAFGALECKNYLGNVAFF